MSAFLQLVGAIVVAIVVALVVLVVGGYFWVRWKIKNLAGNLTDQLAEAFEGIGSALAAGNVPSLRIQLMRLEGHEWGNAEQIEEWTKNLEEQGFDQIGDFDVSPMMMELRAMLHVESSTYAVLYEHPMVGTWFDITSLMEDGQASFTITTDQKNQMDHREEHPNVRVTAITTPAKAFEKFLKDRPQRDWSKVSAGEFVPRFEKAYADEMDWRVKRGGPTEAEIRRIAQQDGTEFNPQMVSSIQDAWANQASYEYEEALQKNYLTQSDHSASEWEEIRDRLFFAHQFTTATYIAEQIGDAILDDDDEEEDAWEQMMSTIRRICDGKSGADAFDRVLEEFHLTRRFEKRGTVSDPIEATVYVCPDYDY